MKLELIKNLCSLPKRKLQNILIQYLKNKGYKNIIHNNMYVIAEGALPVCLCAHIDTVFPAPPQTFYYDKEQTTLWSPDGLGADDRAGCFAIIKLLEKGYRPSIVFTDLEEQGCKGSSALVQDFPKYPFKECKAIIQLDRHGQNDAVYYNCANLEFEDLITSYGFNTEYGSFTDISVLGPSWGIAAVNLSIGYDFEHQYIEILNLSYLKQTINKVEKILKDCNEWKYFNYIPCKNFIPNYINLSINCISCNAEITEEEWKNASSAQINEDYALCNKCYKEYVEQYEKF